MAGWSTCWRSRSCSPGGSLPRTVPGRSLSNQIGAAELHLHVGSRLVLGAGAGNGPPARANVRRFGVRVVGIVVLRGSVVPVTVLDHEPMLLASTALFHLLGMRYRGYDGAFVKLRPGVTAGAFGREAQALTRRYPGTGGHVFVADEAAQAAAIERAIRPSAIALAVFALVLVVTAVLVIGQVAARLLFAASVDNPALSALGMTRRQLAAAGLVEVGLAATAGALLAVGAAVAASPLMPIGPARLAEPDPGVDVNAPVLAAGAAVTVALLVARVAWPAWRLASAGHGESGAAAAVRRRPLLAQWAAQAGATVTATVGVRLALEPGRGRTAVPVRSALAGTALSIAAVAAAFTFGANLVHLVGTPRLYGKTWDVAIDLQFSTVTPQVAEHFLGRVPGLTGWTFGNFGTVRIGGSLVPAIGVAGGRGPLMSVTMLAGHPPRTGPGRAGVLGPAPVRPAGRAVGAHHDQQSAADRPHRRPGRLPELRSGKLHADRPRPGRRDRGVGSDWGRDRQRGGEPGLQLHAAPVRARPTPRRGHRRLRAVHGRHLRTGRTVEVRGA